MDDRHKYAATAGFHRLFMILSGQDGRIPNKFYSVLQGLGGRGIPALCVGAPFEVSSRSMTEGKGKKSREESEADLLRIADEWLRALRRGQAFEGHGFSLDLCANGLVLSRFGQAVGVIRIEDLAFVKCGHGEPVLRADTYEDLAEEIVDMMLEMIATPDQSGRAKLQ